MQLQLKLYPAKIVETKKRPLPFDVTTLFSSDPAFAFAKSLTPQQLLTWVIQNVKYKTESAGQDNWQLANETLRWKTGDCEDGAILLANLLLARGEPYWKILIAVYDGHVCTYFDGEAYDWTGVRTNQPMLTGLLYCFNRSRAYTSLEHIQQWPRGAPT